MIRIAILDNNNHLFDSIASNQQQVNFVTTTALDGESLSAWLAKHGVNMLALHLPNNNEPPATAAINKKTQGIKQTYWQLNSPQLELITPDGKSIRLSHNECCLLGAATNTNGNLVSRKALIEALGQETWNYDERRLETMISRLRRKLLAYAPGDFPIRGVKGQGYLFGIALHETEA
jgi:DNA-binding winged helix-turn-helix (wHTH) protein